MIILRCHIIARKEELEAAAEAIKEQIKSGVIVLPECLTVEYADRTEYSEVKIVEKDRAIVIERGDYKKGDENE